MPRPILPRVVTACSMCVLPIVMVLLSAPSDAGEITPWVYGDADTTHSGPAAGDAGNADDDRTRPDLIYDSTYGNVKLDASDITGNVTSYIFKNAVGGDDFAPGSHTGEPKATFGGVDTNIAVEISWTNPFGGFNAADGLIDLGDIFPWDITTVGDSPGTLQPSATCSRF